LPRNQPNKPSKLKAVFESRSVPIDLFGSGSSRYRRKFVYLYLASYANPDGTGAFPSRRTIARDTGFSIRGLANILKWLKEHRLIESSPERSSYNTCVYTVLFSQEDQAKCRAILASEEKERNLRGKTAETKLARKTAALARWGNRDEEHTIPQVGNTTFPTPREHSVPQDRERVAYIGNATFPQPSFKPSVTERETEGHKNQTAVPVSQVQKASGQELVRAIQATAKKVCLGVVFTLKSNQALRELCKDCDFTLPEVKQAVSRRVGEMDDYETKQAGSLIAANLESDVMELRRAKAEQAVIVQKMDEIVVREQAKAAEQIAEAERKRAEEESLIEETLGDPTPRDSELPANTDELIEAVL
jgi:hypothetical protein